MAHGVPGFVRIGAVIAGLALVAACTPDPGPTPTVSPTGPASSATPTPSATPTETDIERQQRLDFDAAEESYRANVAEQDRLARLGVSRSTPELRRTSAGEYLRFALQGLKEFEDSGWRTDGDSNIVGVSRAGWQRTKLTLIACEDGSQIKIFDAKGRDVTPRVRRTFVQTLTVTRFEKTWKVTDTRSKSVKTFEGTSCGSQG